MSSGYTAIMLPTPPPLLSLPQPMITSHGSLTSQCSLTSVGSSSGHVEKNPMMDGYKRGKIFVNIFSNQSINPSMPRLKGSLLMDAVPS